MTFSMFKVLVPSKHLLGPVQGLSESYAEVAKRWLPCHLEQAGKTTEQLAETLYAKNLCVTGEVRRIPNP